MPARATILPSTTLASPKSKRALDIIGVGLVRNELDGLVAISHDACRSGVPNRADIVGHRAQIEIGGRARVAFRGFLEDRKTFRKALKPEKGKAPAGEHCPKRCLRGSRIGLGSNRAFLCERDRRVESCQRLLEVALIGFCLGQAFLKIPAPWL